MSYDREADALEIRLVDGVAVDRTEQLEPGTMVDLDRRGRAVAIELIRPARPWPLDEIVERFHVDEETARVLASFSATAGNAGNAYPFARPEELTSAASSEPVLT